MSQMIPAALLACLVPIHYANAFEAASDLPNYFVAAVRTEVHRTMVANECTAYAVVNCSGLTNDGKLDLRRLDELHFSRELSELAPADSASVKLVLRYTLSQAQNVTKEDKKVIRNELKKLCRSAGFDNVRTTEVSTTAKWNDTFSAVRSFQIGDTTEETIVEDETNRRMCLSTEVGTGFSQGLH